MPSASGVIINLFHFDKVSAAIPEGLNVYRKLFPNQRNDAEGIEQRYREHSTASRLEYFSGFLFYSIGCFFRCALAITCPTTNTVIPNNNPRKKYIFKGKINNKTCTNHPSGS